MLDDGLELNIWFWHAEGNYGSERQVESVLLPEEIDAAEDEAEAKSELLLAGVVEGGDEGLLKHHLLDVVHKDIDIVQCLSQLSPLIHSRFQTADPVVQIGRITQWLNLYPLALQMFSELHVEQP